MLEKKENVGPLAVTAVMVFSILPYPAIWYGMNVLRDAASTLALYHCACLLPVIVWAFPAWRGSVKMPVRKFIHVGALIVISMSFCASALALYHIAGSMMLSDEKTQQLLKDQGYTKELFWPLSIYFVTVNPVLEELFWRAALIGKLEVISKKIKHFGILWSSFWYGAFHYPILNMVLYQGWAELAALMLMLYGGLLAVYYRKTESIVLPALAHALLTDLSAIALILALFRRFPAAQ